MSPIDMSSAADFIRAIAKSLAFSSIHRVLHSLAKGGELGDGRTTGHGATRKQKNRDAHGVRPPPGLFKEGLMSDRQDNVDVGHVDVEIKVQRGKQHALDKADLLPVFFVDL
jgi:hypothetical protein